jgi:L-alanine-DL-glutamate epimerase-like enolase superfamily enzyme
MRVAELTAYHVRIPLKKKIRHASHTRSETDSLVVRCQLDDGTEGWGEGLPRHYVTGEVIDDAFPLLRSADLKFAFGESYSDLSSAIELCEQFDLVRSSDDPRRCFGNSFRCAVELSILDATCRGLSVPFSTITRTFSVAVGVRKSESETAKPVQYSAAITSMSPFKQRLRAWLIRAYGFSQTKVKVGVPEIDDVSSVARIRGTVGPKIDIRIDANEAWTCENLAAKLRPLEPFGISAIEQPVPHAESDGLAQVRKQISVPIMLDESLCSEPDARRAIELGTCDLFNIRISKCGGFLKSLRLAAIAHQAGLSYQLGCQVGETGILSAAGRHFATSVDGIRYLEGSYEKFLVRERLTVEDLSFGRAGFAPALTEPGLGVSIDEEALRRVTIAQESFPLS